MEEKNKKVMRRLMRIKKGNALKKSNTLKISRTNIFDKKIIIDEIQIR
jgi:hypothetical protein